ncbi:unnamed protein product [Amoebophrya sp. A25]|nr:unnamed protein product [Amoebophrya sp. A25]|eukprot:GSA25T00024157001.1
MRIPKFLTPPVAGCLLLGGVRYGAVVSPIQVSAQEMFPRSSGSVAGGNIKLDYARELRKEQGGQGVAGVAAGVASGEQMNNIVVAASGEQQAPAEQARAPVDLLAEARAHPECGSGRVNGLMMWPGQPESFLVDAHATLESLLFHHPDFNVYVFNLPRGHLARYRKEGYCVFAVPLDWNGIRDVLHAASRGRFTRDQIQEFLYTMQNTPDPAITMGGVVWNSFIFAVQHLYGGLYVPLDGVLLGAVDQFLTTPLADTLMFTERILPEKLDWGLKLEEVKQPRSPTDLADLETGICGDVQMCLRHIPAPERRQLLRQRGVDIEKVAHEYVVHILDQVRNWRNGSPDLEKFGTEMMRTWMREDRMLLLPHWVIQEPSFADGYSAHILVGPEKQTELYSPRFHRSSSDWTLVSTAKLWLPLRYGQISARNALRWSVMDSALLLQSLHISPYPYRTAFHNHDYEKHRMRIEGYHLSMGVSDSYKNFAPHGVNETIQAGIIEGGYPGIVGGFRTFGRIRVVGRPWTEAWVRGANSNEAQQVDTQSAQQSHEVMASMLGSGDVGAAPTGFPYPSVAQAEGSMKQRLRLVIRVNKQVALFCRNAAVPSKFEWRDEAWFQKCERALKGAQRFEMCASSSEINSVVRLLSYRGNYVKEMSTAVARVTDEKNLAIREQIEAHYGLGYFALFQGCDVVEPGYEQMTLADYAKVLAAEKQATGDTSAGGGAGANQQTAAQQSSSSSGDSPQHQQQTASDASKMRTAGTVTTPSLEGTEDRFAGQTTLPRHNLLDFRGLKLLLDDPESVITIAAHSASRCWMLERLADSLKTSYPTMPIIGTCECAEEDTVCDATPIQKSDVLTVYPVPYDFGLSQGKTRLTELSKTEYLLILDDDFVRTHHTCIECMLAKMYSYWHTSFLPLDLVGFPVLEDERNFGAYRGKFRLQNTALFLEPFYHGNAPDGCIRVDFCPMVYLARRERMKQFVWKPELKVGEHEYFFYTNKLRGIQTGVCFDSSFAHARHKPQTALATYQPRRDRFLDLMMGAFAVGGITRVMYLFRTYQMTETKDFDELADREVAPWDISDDTCGPSQEPVAPFVVLFVALLSSPENSQTRNYLRSGKNSWLRRLQEMGQLSYTFVIPGDPSQTPGVMAEQAQWNDMVFAPHVEWTPKPERDAYERKYPTAKLIGGTGGAPLATEFGGGMLRFIFEFLRKRFQFRWILVQHDDVYLHLGTFLDTLGDCGEPENKVIGRLYDEPGMGPEKMVDGLSFVLSRDLFQVLTDATFLSRSRVTDSLTGTINRWLLPFEVTKIELPYAKFRLENAQCPLDAAFLHPINPEAMQLMDDHARPNEPPCGVFYREELGAPGEKRAEL